MFTCCIVCLLCVYNIISYCMCIYRVGALWPVAVSIPARLSADAGRARLQRLWRTCARPAGGLKERLGDDIIIILRVIRDVLLNSRVKCIYIRYRYGHPDRTYFKTSQDFHVAL